MLDVQGVGVVAARIIIDGRHMATTQQHGTYHLDSMKPGSYRLSVEAPRMTFDEAAVKVTPNTPQLPSIIASTSVHCCSALAANVDAYVFYVFFVLRKLIFVL